MIRSLYSSSVMSNVDGMATSEATNLTTDYPPSYKARPLCRTEVIKEEVAEKTC